MLESEVMVTHVSVEPLVATLYLPFSSARTFLENNLEARMRIKLNIICLQ